MLPLYEAKMIHLYDTRWATYEPDGSTRLMTEQEKADRKAPLPRYWVAEQEVDKKLDGKWDKAWFLAWRRISNTTNERTMVTTVVPKVAMGDSIFVMLPQASASARGLLRGAMSSVCFDYVTRQNMGGTNLNFFLVEQLPAPAPGSQIDGLRFDVPQESWLARMTELLDLHGMSPERARQTRAELDAYFFHLYGVSRVDAEYMMGTFPITRSKDIDQNGEFLTQRLVLEAYDAMAHAIEASKPYVCPFDQGAHS